MDLIEQQNAIIRGLEQSLSASLLSARKGTRGISEQRAFGQVIFKGSTVEFDERRRGCITLSFSARRAQWRGWSTFLCSH